MIIKGKVKRIIMKNKILPLVISGALISFSALSQTTEKSTHPKLDALFPHSQNTTTTNIPDSKKAPVTNIVTTNNTIPSMNIPETTIAPVTNIATSNNTLPANNIPETTTAPATNIVTGNNIKPASTITFQDKPQEEVQTRPEQKEIYRDTRLGSSTKQYDTYEKNDNGTGAVTTRPK